MKKIDEITLLDILPVSLKNDEILKISEGIDKILHRINNKTDKTYIYKNLDETYPEVIDELFWEWHVDYYSEDLDLNKKIKLIKSSYMNHLRKGTPWAVENMLNDILEGYYLLEWFDYGGQPYHFKVVTQNEINANILSSINKAIMITKNVRSYFEGVVQLKTIKSSTNYKYGHYVASDYTFIQKNQPKIAYIPQHLEIWL